MYTLIRTELDADPGTYASLSDQEVALELNKVIPATDYRVLTGNELIPWAATGSDAAPAIATGWPRKDRMFAASTEQAPYGSIGKAIAALAWAAWELISKDNTVLDLNRADRIAMLDGLVAAQVLTAAEKAELLTLAQLDESGNPRTTTRAAQIGVTQRVLTRHVTKARAL